MNDPRRTHRAAVSLSGRHRTPPQADPIGVEIMEPNIRLVAKIYRAIREFAGDAPIDEAKCERIASLIGQSDFATRIEALVEQQADRIQDMPAEDFVACLCSQAAREDARERAES
jgi:hypothetical protein